MEPKLSTKQQAVFESFSSRLFGGRSPTPKNRFIFYRLKALGLIKPLVLEGSTRKVYVLTEVGAALRSNYPMTKDQQELIAGLRLFG